jgi:hypothetical protein
MPGMATEIRREDNPRVRRMTEARVFVRSGGTAICRRRMRRQNRYCSWRSQWKAPGRFDPWLWWWLSPSKPEAAGPEAAEEARLLRRRQAPTLRQFQVPILQMM